MAREVSLRDGERAPPQPQSVPSSAHFVTDQSDEDEIPEWAQAAGVTFSHPQAASAAASSVPTVAQAAGAAAPQTPVVSQAAGAATSGPCAAQTASAVTLAPRSEVKEENERRSRSASAARGALPIQWQELSKPRKRGRIRPLPSHVRAEFPFLLDEWLFNRGLSGVLSRNHEQERLEQQDHYKGQEKGLRRWLIYDYNRRQEPIDPTWVQAFHGTWWYSLWSVLESGVMLESNAASLGHDIWEPGAYVTPLLETAAWYGRPQIVFMDGVYQRAGIELRVDKKRIKRGRERGGIQWVFPADAVKIVGFRFKTNAPPKQPEQRFETWEPRLEAIPDHHEMPQDIDRHMITMSPIPPDDEDYDSNVSESTGDDPDQAASAAPVPGPKPTVLPTPIDFRNRPPLARRKATSVPPRNVQFAKEEDEDMLPIVPEEPETLPASIAQTSVGEPPAATAHDDQDMSSESYQNKPQARLPCMICQHPPEHPQLWFWNQLRALTMQDKTERLSKSCGIAGSHLGGPLSCKIGGPKTPFVIQRNGGIVMNANQTLRPKPQARQTGPLTRDNSEVTIHDIMPQARQGHLVAEDDLDREELMPQARHAPRV
eukprot:1498402-Amphidinium_carterae.1